MYIMSTSADLFSVLSLCLVYEGSVCFAKGQLLWKPGHFLEGMLSIMLTVAFGETRMSFPIDFRSSDVSL